MDLPVLILSRFLRSPVHRTAARKLGVSVVVASLWTIVAGPSGSAGDSR